MVAVLLIKKSLARRVYATILNAGTNTDGSKEQGGHEGRKRAWITRNGEVEHARLDTVMPCPATTLPYHYSTLPYHYHYPALPLPYPATTLSYHYPSTVGVTYPSGEAQEQLICSLYQPAGLAPESLEYIEAHGTGTKVKALSGPYL